MMTHPYRGASDVDPAAHEGGNRCLFCRTKRALARIPWRTVVVSGAVLVLTAVNATSAAVAHASLHDARKALAAATALDAARSTLHPRHPAPPAPPPPAPRLQPAPVQPQCGADWWTVGGIDRISETEFAVDRRVVNRALEQSAELMGHTRILPVRQNGNVTGVRILGVEPDSLLGRLGIQNGDALQSVNGLDITRPENALEAYGRLRTVSDVTVRLQRRGAPLSIRYHLT